MFTSIIITVSAQIVVPKEYQDFIIKSDSLYKIKNYLNSAETYSLAFQSFGWKGFVEDRYKAARSWALANMPDSAFSQLDRITVKAKYSEYDLVVNDTALISLHNDKRWQGLIEKIKKNKIELKTLRNNKINKIIDSLVFEDQKWRKYLTSLQNGEVNNDTLTLDDVQAIISKTDSLNLIELMKIIETYGFPDHDMVGTEGTSNFWLLVQHQDQAPDFQEDILIKMKAAADKGKASLTDYAYLLDRVKVNTGQLQIYGTQMQLNSLKTSYEPKPLIEPEKVNERRQSVGLNSIESYIKRMNNRYFGSLNKN
jgi:hypothetical protein